MTDVATSNSGSIDRDRTRDEDWANAVTHGLGLAGSVIGAIALLALAFARGDAWQKIGCSIYAVTLVATYAASTLSHAVTSPRGRHVFRMADQALIFLFIAGSYTGVAATWMRGGNWWILHTVMWTIAVFGFASKAIFEHRVHIGAVSAWLYLGLGWAPLFCAKGLATALPAGLQPWMIGGGVCYTLGLVFFYLDHRYPYFHATWHVLVVAGSACHYFGILLYCATAPV